MKAKIIIGIVLLLCLLFTGCVNSYQSCKADCKTICLKELPVDCKDKGVFDCIGVRSQHCNDVCYEECKKETTR